MVENHLTLHTKSHIYIVYMGLIQSRIFHSDSGIHLPSCSLNKIHSTGCLPRFQVSIRCYNSKACHDCLTTTWNACPSSIYHILSHVQIWCLSTRRQWRTITTYRSKLWPSPGRSSVSHYLRYVCRLFSPSTQLKVIRYFTKLSIFC